MDTQNQEGKKTDLYTLSVSVWDPTKLLFQGDAQSITSYNEKGLFDVIPLHENFITIIKDRVIVRSEGQENEFQLQKGVMKVEENNVDIFLGAETLG